METTMINRKRESGFFNPFALAVTAIAICLALAVGAAAALAPTATSSDISTDSTETYGGAGGYFPPQLLDRVREFEVMPDMFE